jgi:hypothetical protein
MFAPHNKKWRSMPELKRLILVFPVIKEGFKDNNLGTLYSPETELALETFHWYSR